MNILLVILFILISLFIFDGQLTRIKHNYLGMIFSFSFVYILSGFVTYTPDWLGYEYIIKESKSRDFVFNYIQEQFLTYYDDYSEMHLMFTAAYTFLLILIISKFTKSVLLVSILYLSIVYLFYTTQIRFFMAYYSFYLALYYWNVKKNSRLGFVLLLFALLNHLAIIYLLPLVYFHKINTDKLIKTIIKVLVVSSLIYYIFNGLIYKFVEGIVLMNYLFGTEYNSSILGGLLSFIPYILLTYAIYDYGSNKIKEYPLLINDKKFNYLYRQSIIPILFMGIALNRQIIGHRFIVPAVLFQILILLYTSKLNTRKKNIIIAVRSIFAYVFFMIYTYLFVPLIVGDRNIENIIRMLETNSIISYFI